MKVLYKLQNCYIEKNKLIKYLLNLHHPQGKGKAIFFTEMGFNRAEYRMLKKELIQLTKNNKAEKVWDDEFFN